MPGVGLGRPDARPQLQRVQAPRRIEGRRQLDALLARHAVAERRRTEFTAAADRVTAIDDDPLGYASEFLDAYPDARSEYSF
jgi:hypothetical protein